MSEVSVLSQEYKTASDLSQHLNAALITLKKARLGLSRPEANTHNDLECEQRFLADVVRALLHLLAPRRSRPHGSEDNGNILVPGALVAYLRAERQGDLDYYLEDLEQVEAHLRKGVRALTDADLTRLDELATAADAQTSSVFRRLMRT